MSDDMSQVAAPPTPEEQALAVGDYWEGHPEPPDEPVTADAQAMYDQEMAAWESKFGTAGPPEPPEPPTIPGPPSPGAGMPAARLGDLTAHGGTVGPVVTGISAGVMINFMPAACMGDMHVCPMFDGPKPHVGGVITQGSTSVLIGFVPAAVLSNVTECKGPPGAIAMGETSVLIGDAPPPLTPATMPPAVAGADLPSNRAGSPAARVATAQSQAQAASQALVAAAAAGTPMIELTPPIERLSSVIPKEVAETWIAFEVLDDDTGEPVAGVVLTVKTSDGQTRDYVTDSRGKIKIDALPPGAATIVKVSHPATYPVVKLIPT